MVVDPIASWAVTSLLLGMRLAPVFALAPPFTLTRVPVPFRVLFALGVSACLVSGLPQTAWIDGFGAGRLVALGARELMVGSVFVLAFQVTFGALYLAGRTLDIQAGYGLAVLIDPTTRAQTPLVGTLFAYAAAAVFFAMDGHGALLRLFSASLDAIPIGAGQAPTSLGRLTAFVSVVFTTAMGVAGAAVLCLFLADLAITMLSRTVPQMNVLMLGLQVKSLLLLLVLPTTFGVAGALFARLATMTLEAIPGLL